MKMHGTTIKIIVSFQFPVWCVVLGFLLHTSYTCNTETRSALDGRLQQMFEYILPQLITSFIIIFYVFEIYVGVLIRFASTVIFLFTLDISG